jgi:general secretion pathway protein F
MQFRYEAFDRAGNLVTGRVGASDEQEARRIVEGKGVTLFELMPASGALGRSIFGVELIGAPLRDCDVSWLARELALLLEAGVPLDTCLRIAIGTAEDVRARTAAEQLLEAVLEGSSLAHAMERMEGVFRPEYTRIVECGEAGAALGPALAEVADLIDRRLEVRSRVKAALAYPMVLVGLALVSLWIVLGVLLPAVTPIFLENGLDLPLVIAALDAVRSHSDTILAILAGIATVSLVLAVAGRRNEAAMSAADRMFLRIPVLGPIARIREAARFTRTLAALLRAGVPALQALQTSIPLVRNRHLRRGLDAVTVEVRAGATLAGAVARAEALPQVARQMIMVGEESGRLSDMLLRAATVLERQEQHRTARALGVLTPAVTILVASLIAAVILSVMGAILSINELALL